MSMKRIVVAFLVVAILVAIMLGIYRKCVRASKWAHTVGTVEAIEAAFYSEFERGDSILKEILPAGEHGWRVVTPEEYEKVMAELDGVHNLDIPRGVPHRFLDLWGNRYEIAYCRDANGLSDSMVVSRGPDGSYGTKDDIVSQYGAKPPLITEK